MTRLKSNTNSSLQIAKDEFTEVKNTLLAAAYKIRRNALDEVELLAKREYRLKGEELKERVNGIKLKYNELQGEIDLALNPESQGVLGRYETSEFRKRINDLVITLGEARKKLQTFSTVVIRKPIGLSFYEKCVMSAPFALLLLDSVFEAPAIRYVVGSMLFSIPTAIAFNLLKYFVAKFLNLKIAKTSNRQTKVVLVFTGVAVFLGIAVVMGYLRQGYLEAQEIETMYGPFALGFLSCVLGIAAWITEYFAAPIREHKKDIQKQQTRYDEYAEKLKVVKDIEAEIEQVKAERGGVLGGRIITIENARTLQKMLNKHFLATVNEYQVQFRSHRTADDGFETPFMSYVPSLDDDEFAYVETDNGIES